MALETSLMPRHIAEQIVFKSEDIWPEQNALQFTDKIFRYK